MVKLTDTTVAAAPQSWPSVSIYVTDTVDGTTATIGSATARSDALLDGSLQLYLRKCQAYLLDKQDRVTSEGVPVITFEVHIRNVTAWSSLLMRLEPYIVKLGLHDCANLKDIPALLERMPHLQGLELGDSPASIRHVLSALLGDGQTPKGVLGSLKRNLASRRSKSRAGEDAWAITTPTTIKALTLVGCNKECLDAAAALPVLHDHLQQLNLKGIADGFMDLQLQPTFPALQSLTLHCENNVCTELKVAGSTALLLLDLAHAEGVTGLQAVQLPALKQINLNKALENLTVHDCPAFCKLQLQEAPPPLTHVNLTNTNNFAPFNLSGCPTLVSITYIGHMNLQECKLMQCPNLERITLGLPGSHVASLVVSQCSKLKDIDCTASVPGVKCSHPCPDLSTVNISNCPALGTLKLSPAAQRLTSFTLKSLQSLKAVPQLSNCPLLREVAVLGCTALLTLKVVNCSQLACLLLDHCQNIKEVVLSQAANLHRLGLSDCKSLTSLTLADCPKLHDALLQSLPVLASMTVSGCEGLPVLELSNLTARSGGQGASKAANSLSNLKVSKCGALKGIKWAVGSHPPLTSLSIQQAALLKLPPLNVLKTIRELSIIGASDVSELELHDLPDLRQVELSGNEGLMDLSVADCAQLSSMVLSGNEMLINFKLTGCTALQSLVMDAHPELHSLTIRSCDALKTVDLTSCVGGSKATGACIKKLQVLHCANLEAVRLPSPAQGLQVVRLISLPKLSVPPALASCTQLSDVALQRLDKLTSISLRACTALAVLDIRHCALMAQIILSGCRKLRGDGDIELEALPSLQRVIFQACSSLQQVPAALWREAPKLAHVDLRDCPQLHTLHWALPPPMSSLYNPQWPSPTPTAAQSTGAAASAAAVDEQPPWGKLDVVLDPAVFDRLNSRGQLEAAPDLASAKTLRQFLSRALGVASAQGTATDVVFGIDGNTWRDMPSADKFAVASMMDRAGFKHQSQQEQLEYAARCTAKLQSRGASRGVSLAGSRASSRPTSRLPSASNSTSTSRANSRAASPTRQRLCWDSDSDDDDFNLGGHVLSKATVRLSTDGPDGHTSSSSLSGDSSTGATGGESLLPPVLFRHRMYGHGCVAPVPITGQSGRRVAGSTELETDMESCGAACRGAKQVEGAPLAANGLPVTAPTMPKGTRKSPTPDKSGETKDQKQPGDGTAAPIVRAIKVTTRHHSRTDAHVSFPIGTVPRSWGPFRAQPYPNKLMASAVLGICRHSESSICILLPKLGLAVTDMADVTDDEAIVPLAVSLQVAPSHSIESGTKVALEDPAAPPIQAYMLQEVPPLKPCVPAVVSITANATASALRATDSPRRRTAADLKNSANKYGNSQRSKLEIAPPPSTNALISACLRTEVASNILAKPCIPSALYHLELDGASPVRREEWQGTFNALQLKPFELHSHWKPQFTKWDGGNWKRGIVRVDMSMRVKAGRMVRYECPLRSAHHGQTIAFVSFLQPVRMPGRTGEYIELGPLQVTFKF